MFGSESYNNLYHQKHAAKSGVPSQLNLNNQKPFQSFGTKMPRNLMSNKPDMLENQIAQLWKTNGNNESYTCTEDIWKFYPSANTMSNDYSSLSSASQSPEDHAETFFNVASQVCSVLWFISLDKCAVALFVYSNRLHTASFNRPKDNKTKWLSPLSVVLFAFRDLIHDEQRLANWLLAETLEKSIHETFQSLF